MCWCSGRYYCPPSRRQNEDDDDDYDDGCGDDYKIKQQLGCIEDRSYDTEHVESEPLVFILRVFFFSFFLENIYKWTLQPNVFHSAEREVHRGLWRL